MTTPTAVICGLGACIPDQVVTNHDLSTRMDTTDEWIRTRTDPDRAAGGLDEEFRIIPENLMPNPVICLDDFWNIAACNQSAREVFGLQPHDTNLLVAYFTNPVVSDRYVDSEFMARISVAQFRADMVAYFDDPRFHSLRRYLTERSAQFGRLWTDHEVLDTVSKTKRIQHPVVGRLVFDTHVWRLVGDEGMRMLLYIPSEATPTRSRLERALAPGGRGSGPSAGTPGSGSAGPGKQGQERPGRREPGGPDHPTVDPAVIH